MADEKRKEDKIALRWYHIRRVRLTGEYVGGTLVGLGVGVCTMCSMAHHEVLREHRVLITIASLGIMTIGAWTALYAQDRYAKR